MKQSYYTLIIIFFTIVATLIATLSKDKIYNQKYKFLNQPKHNIYWLIIVSFLAGLFTILKDISSEKIDNRKDFVADSLAKINKRINDSLRKSSDSLSSAKIREGTDKTIVTFSSALSKYGLALSEENKIIKAKIDSSKLALPDPELVVDNIYEEPSKNDSLVLKVVTKSVYQASLNCFLYSTLIVKGW